MAVDLVLRLRTVIVQSFKKLQLGLIPVVVKTHITPL